jgi:hypothetical protein
MAAPGQRRPSTGFVTLASLTAIDIEEVFIQFLHAWCNATSSECSDPSPELGEGYICTSTRG